MDQEFKRLAKEQAMRTGAGGLLQSMMEDTFILGVKVGVTRAAKLCSERDVSVWPHAFQEVGREFAEDILSLIDEADRMSPPEDTL